MDLNDVFGDLVHSKVNCPALVVLFYDSLSGFRNFVFLLRRLQLLDLLLIVILILVKPLSRRHMSRLAPQDIIILKLSEEGSSILFLLVMIGRMPIPSNVRARATRVGDVAC